MSFVNKTLDGGDGTYYKFSGVLKSDDLVRLVSYRLKNNFHRFSNLKYAIIDFSDVNMFVLKASFLDNMIKLCNNLSKANPNLIVATIIGSKESDDFNRKMTSQIKDSTWFFKSFYEYDEAVKWIKI